MYSVGIAGVGYYLPKRVVTNKEFVKYVDTTEEWLEEKIGIKERRFVAEDEAMSDISYNAAIKAIADAELKIEDIDLIIVCAVNQDHRVPTTAAILQKKIRCKKCSSI